MAGKAAGILALIPARSSSKSIPHKNIRMFGDKPLLAHSILHGLQARMVDRVIVSTDSPQYAEIARRYGADVPFLRPVEFAGDLSPDIKVFTHALNWLKDNEGCVPEICVHLRPTYPIRSVNDIDNMIDIILKDPDIDSVRSVAPAAQTPFKMWFMDKENRLSAVTSCGIPEAYNQPRQRLPVAYMQNACIDVVRSRVILEIQSMTGSRILGYSMDHNFDIDTEEEWKQAERYYLKRLQEAGSDCNIAGNGCKTYCFDIDGVIASVISDLQYDKAKPLRNNIKKINRLYEFGHEIILFTARGSKTGKDWKDVTEKQMSKWGVKYHRLIFKKPAADFYVDDKCIHIEQL